MRLFYDLTCPYCYLTLPLTASLRRQGVALTELPFQAHPEIPKDGMHMGPRRGPMYDNIAARARAANLKLKWQDKLPNSRLALAAAEWVRREKPEKADEVREKLFEAHFAGARDIGDIEVLVDVVGDCGLDGDALRTALADKSALRFVNEAEKLGRGLGVSGTPCWESRGRVGSGLLEEEVWRLAKSDSEGAEL